MPNGFTPPDWVFVTPRGATIINSPNSSVIGRYSYAVYAEGGLLDMNVAGYPTGTTADATRAGRKGSVGFADLTHLCPTTDCTAQDFGIPNPNASGVYQIDRVVGWRNYATTQPSNNFPDAGPPANKAFAYNFQTGTGPATAFYNYVLNNTNGFLSPSTATAPNGRTDQVFVQRQALIGFRTATQFSANALQYLSTFSSETNAPSFSPSTPAGSNIDYAALATTATAINPNFLLRRVTTGFTRFDGTTSIVGEPLVKTRFPLSRLAWITYKGPSAAVYALNNNDPVITALLNAGVSLSTITAGTAANVKACFGLCFGTTCAGTVGDPSNPWTYSNPTGTGQASRILRLDEVAAAGREPDFFELLQAGILSGSLGQDTGGPGGTRGTTGGNVFPDVHMNSTIQHLLTIGACIIDQADPDSIPARIQFTGSNGNAWTAYGVENLPYIAQIYPLAGQSRDDATNTKWATYLLFQLWNPHQSPVAVSNNVRLRVDGGIGIFTGGNTPPQTWNPATTANIYPPVGQAQPTAVILCPPGRTSYSFSTPKSIATDYTNTNTTAPGGFAFLLSPPSVP